MGRRENHLDIDSLSIHIAEARLWVDISKLEGGSSAVSSLAPYSGITASGVFEG
jgi:hypothetical protein